MIREKWVSREELFEILGAGSSPVGSVDFTRVTGLTTGSIPFADAGGNLSEDNAALFWDAAEDNLGIGVNTFSATMTQGIQMGTGLAPTADVPDSFAFYSADFIAGNACPHFRTENGTVIGLNQSLLTTDNVTFGTLGCSGPLTITQNSDTLILSHDGSNANIKWSDGDLALMTDEGTNTNTSVAILGKGTGVGVLEVYDTDDDSYITLGWKGDDQPSISCNPTPTEFNFLHLRPIPVKFWSSIISGNPYFYIYGYKTAEGVKYLRQRVEADGDALIQAEGNLTILADGGAISFGNENLTTTGTITAPTYYIGDTEHEAPSTTTGAWNKSIGGGGTYADWSTMIDAIPDLIAHAVTVTIKAGTTLTEICDIKNKHAITSAGTITVQAEKYFPTSGAIPLTDSATATTLRDGALATAALGNDYFNGCWVFIVHGTGTDNGYVLITDYIDATGDVVVAAWPGTQPNNTSRYIIVGALIDGANTRLRCFDIQNNTCPITFKGIGMDDPTYACLSSYRNFKVTVNYCGLYDATGPASDGEGTLYFFFENCGIVKNNTGNTASYAGIMAQHCNLLYLSTCALSDNNRQGIVLYYNTQGLVASCFGDGNGVWGTYSKYSGQARMIAPECSGSSGNHSDEGTADTAGDDQAASYT